MDWGALSVFDLLSHGQSLWVRGGRQPWLLQFLNRVPVVHEIEFSPHQDDGGVGTVRSPPLPTTPGAWPSSPRETRAQKQLPPKAGESCREKGALLKNVLNSRILGIEYSRLIYLKLWRLLYIEKRDKT